MLKRSCIEVNLPSQSRGWLTLWRSSSAWVPSITILLVLLKYTKAHYQPTQVKPANKLQKDMHNLLSDWCDCEWNLGPTSRIASVVYGLWHRQMGWYYLILRHISSCFFSDMGTQGAVCWDGVLWEGPCIYVKIKGKKGKATNKSTINYCYPVYFKAKEVDHVSRSIGIQCSPYFHLLCNQLFSYVITGCTVWKNVNTCSLGHAAWNGACQRQRGGFIKEAVNGNVAYIT